MAVSSRARQTAADFNSIEQNDVAQGRAAVDGWADAEYPESISRTEQNGQNKVKQRQSKRSCPAERGVTEPNEQRGVGQR